MTNAWPFADLPMTAVSPRNRFWSIAPIRYVAHVHDDGAWQFLSGDAADEADARIVALRTIIATCSARVAWKIGLGRAVEQRGVVMHRDRVDAYMEEIVRTQPHAPRTFRVRRLWELALTNEARWFYLFGICVLLAGVYNTLRVERGLFPPAYVWLNFLVGSAILCIPIYAVWERFAALRWGKVAIARVLSVRTTATAAHGYWEIDTGTQWKTGAFLVFASWAPTLRAASVLYVLLHPRTARYLIAIGPR